jgi:lactoylglutathione lyase
MMSTSEFQHACYRVGDIESSLDFYGALGFEERRRFHISDVETKVMIGLPGDGDRLGLTFLDGIDHYELGSGFNHIALTVPDVHATLARLALHGCEPEQAPFRPREEGPLIAFVSDPDGYRVELIEAG